MLIENQKTVNELQLAWNEKFAFLSELKTNNERRQKVNEWQVYYSPIFEKMDKGTIISLINKYVLGEKQFVVGQPVITDAHNLYYNFVNKKNPVGRPKQNNVQYKRNIKPEFVKKMDEYLQELKSKEIAIYLNEKV